MAPLLLTVFFSKLRLDFNRHIFFYFIILLYFLAWKLFFYNKVISIMNNINTWLFICFLPLLFFSGQNDKIELALIVNKNNTINTMTKSEVKLTYLRKLNKRWPGINKNIIPVDRKDISETKKIFLSKLLNMTEQDLNRYFTEREYMNAEMPPIVFNNDAEIIEYVANNIGAIGYVNMNSLNSEDKLKVKIVFSEK